MKNLIFKSGLKAIIAIVMIGCSTVANAQSTRTKFFYNGDKENITVYTSEDGKTLNRKLKYENKFNDEGMLIEKKAYRWNNELDMWKPYYLLAINQGLIDTKMNYAEWNDSKKNFCNNIQQSTTSLYQGNLLATRYNKK